MSALRSSWFYIRLILANIQFLGWFFWQQDLATQIVGVSAAWLLLAGLLATKQLLAWQLPNSLVLTPQPNELASHQVTWHLADPNQLEKLCQKLASAQELQPTHRDVLINLALCRATTDQKPTKNQFWQQAKKLDPNFF